MAAARALMDLPQLDALHICECGATEDRVARLGTWLLDTLHICECGPRRARARDSLSWECVPVLDVCEGGHIPCRPHATSVHVQKRLVSPSVVLEHA